MQYFTNKFFKFFDELQKNNNKEWFEKNRAVYETEVKQPFRKLVEDLTENLAKDYPETNRNASKAIFRINRDIRFSKDKSPYKLNVGASFNKTGTKDFETPGFYVGIGADEIGVGGGKYFCSKEDVAKIRQEIYYNHDKFKKILTAKSFKEKYEDHSIIDQMISEVLSKDAKAGDWIHDFVHSDNPKFKGKSKAMRKKMALAAYYSKQNEEKEQPVNDIDQSKEKQLQQPLLPK